ncbi:hypothetical protein BDZ89DRAFT_1055748 [Hymenopellis radicata]|nr:hypothetical protein BDZ89DRAFT_1055748 [Hymenopellis radicata]
MTVLLELERTTLTAIFRTISPASVLWRFQTELDVRYKYIVPSFPASCSVSLTIMIKSVTPLSAQLVTFTTTLPISQVLERLDREVNRANAGGLFPLLRTSETKEDLQNGLNEMTRGNNFIFFLQMEHTSCTKTVVYTIGNPLLAQTMMQHDMRAAYYVPPRILIKERVGTAGTEVIYHLPSSVIVMDSDNDALRAAAEVLDEKLEKLIVRVTE